MLIRHLTVLGLPSLRINIKPDMDLKIGRFFWLSNLDHCNKFVQVVEISAEVNLKNGQIGKKNFKIGEFIGRVFVFLGPQVLEQVFLIRLQSSSLFLSATLEWAVPSRKRSTG